MIIRFILLSVLALSLTACGTARIGRYEIGFVGQITCAGRAENTAFAFAGKALSEATCGAAQKAAGMEHGSDYASATDYGGNMRFEHASVRHH